MPRRKRRSTSIRTGSRATRSSGKARQRSCSRTRSTAAPAARIRTAGPERTRCASRRKARAGRGTCGTAPCAPPIRPQPSFAPSLPARAGLALAPSRSTRRLPRRSQGQVPPASLNDSGNLSIAARIVNCPSAFVAPSCSCRVDVRARSRRPGSDTPRQRGLQLRASRRGQGPPSRTGRHARPFRSNGHPPWRDRLLRRSGFRQHVLA